jgi:hypothetical protein
VRFDELILRDPHGEFRVRFHPELTVLSGLSPADRRALTGSILGALVGGPEPTTLRYLDHTGRPVTLECDDGRVTARQADGSTSAPPLDHLGGTTAARALMVLAAEDLGLLRRPPRDDEPPELREARTMLDELTAELEAALSQKEAADRLQIELDAVDEDLRVARDGVARREYAQVLAQLERVRAEGAALQSGTAGIEADRNLLASADQARALAARWREAAARVVALTEELREGGAAGSNPGAAALPAADRDRLAQVPPELPPALDDLVAALQQSLAARDALDHRLQELSVAKLPAPSQPAVADLGLLDQAELWRIAQRLVEASTAMQHVQVSLGGLELDEMGPAPALIEEIEAAHQELEEAERAAEASRLPGLAGTVGGAALGARGMLVNPLLLPVGLAAAAGAAFVGIVRPGARRARAARAERQALTRADATSYLGFHIRRVEASVDPQLREVVERTTVEHRAALAAWQSLVGEDLEVAQAMELRAEIEAYSEALGNLGQTAEEIEQLRRELDERAEPQLRAARDGLVAAVAAYGLSDEELEPLLHHGQGIPAALERQCAQGAAARAQVALDRVAAEEADASNRLDELLLQLGFDAGPLDARVGALEWAVTRAAEREEARAKARPRAEIDAEIVELQNTAAQLRRPEWATVTAADAEAPDLGELEARRAELVSELSAARADVDVDRLADRHAAVERRVTALEARLGGYDVNGDPGAIADIQQHLLAHLAKASQAGPDNDAVPVVLDEVFLRVPADRTWDLLDLVLRLAERHQLIYLTDDAFVAAWARQRALDGAITLLELAPEHQGEPAEEPSAREIAP